MRLVPSLICAVATALVGCGQGAEPFPPSGATALAWCTMTAVGTLDHCAILQSSVPGSAAWLLEGLQRLKLEENDDRPVEISMLLHVTVHREDGSSAP